MTEQEQREIVKRLRRVDNLYSAPMCREAADLIETLTRERDGARRLAVPREPTDAMIDAAFRVRLNIEMVGGQVAAAWWRAMHDAALSSLTPGGEG